ncbi:hypothetical protein [Salipiger mucosus]|uniref:Putative bacteriophage protein n=1 Tax=Salipiger mucosus DSM 16094 TaxID=1123237 RepID=S9S3M6_9RHOB|nr:hypothetical protein [Salipiger mucosus]EPX84800.1 putative bacteriophage protein [Salipiger mucosus DSM 16094]
MDYEAIAKWALSGTTGASAETMARHFLGMPTSGAYPHDGGDFRRCESLLEAVPELRERLPEMAQVNAYWATLVEHWEDIRMAGDKYARIRSVIGPLETADPGHVDLGGGVSMRFGR